MNLLKTSIIFWLKTFISSCKIYIINFKIILTFIINLKLISNIYCKGIGLFKRKVYQLKKMLNWTLLNFIILVI